MTITLVSVLHETRMSEQYGMGRIRLAHETVYVKSRECSAGCTGGLWLSRSSDRCKPPDPATDYALNASQILYAREGDRLVLPENSHAITRPTGGDWIDMRLIPPHGIEASTLPLHFILFGDHLPARNVPGDQVDFQPCVRAFGHDWNWL